MPSPVYKLINQQATALATQIATAAITASQTKTFSNAAQATNYTPTANDVGQIINMAVASGNVFVVASSNKLGDVFHVFNSSSGTITVTQNTNVTIYLAGATVGAAASTGNRTLASKGYATLTCVGANNYVISSGSGVF
jgi:hypothetical protein